MAMIMRFQNTREMTCDAADERECSQQEADARRARQDGADKQTETDRSF
jgi:hypothetical protein